MHGYLSRDGVQPDLFRKQALDEIGRYERVEVRWEAAISAERSPDGTFTVELEKTGRAGARKLLLASGLMDELPPIPGVEDFFGTSVFPCPYCDGWEIRDTPIAVYGRGRRGFEMARAMTAWTRDILLCTDGRADFSRAQRYALRANDIAVEPDRIAALHGQKGQLESISFLNGRSVSRRALFFDTPTHPQSDLARAVGCEITAAGGIRCGKYEASSVPGVFVAGNILKDVQLSIVAAAEGARAAFGINRALTREDFSRRAGGSPAAVEHPGPGSANVSAEPIP
jgi:thioredoxin reductase